MIGYNEYQEAMNLLALLLESRQKLAMFNASDEDIARAMETDVRDAQAMRTVRAAWYGDLAVWAREKRLSGMYALCFTDETQVQRKPYDLLARLQATDPDFKGDIIPARGAWTMDQMRAAHAAHTRGEGGLWVRAGEAEYQRTRKQRARSSSKNDTTTQEDAA